MLNISTNVRATFAKLFVARCFLVKNKNKKLSGLIIDNGYNSWL